MIYSFTLFDETPSKKNSRVYNLKTMHSFASPRFIKWYKSAKPAILAQMQKHENTGGCFPLQHARLECIFYHKENRPRDLDNQITSIIDLLKDCAVIADDSWQFLWKIEARAEKSDNAKVDIIIEG